MAAPAATIRANSASLLGSLKHWDLPADETVIVLYVRRLPGPGTFVLDPRAMPAVLAGESWHIEGRFAEELPDCLPGKGLPMEFEVRALALPRTVSPPPAIMGDSEAA